MAIIMLFSWQVTGKSIYQAPLQKSLEATYTGSNIKNYVDRFSDNLKNKAPIPAAIAPVGYSLFIKKQINITSSKLSIVPETVTTYNYDERTKSGSIGVVWTY